MSSVTESITKRHGPRLLLGGESLDDFLSREDKTSSDMSNLDVQFECSDVSNLSVLSPIDSKDTLQPADITHWLEQSKNRIKAGQRLTLSTAYKTAGQRTSSAVAERNRKRDRQRIWNYARIRLRQALNLADQAGQLADDLPTPDDCEAALLEEIQPLLAGMHVKISSEQAHALDHETLYKLIHDGASAALDGFQRGYLNRASARGKRSQAIAEAKKAPPALKFTTDDFRLAVGRTERERMASVGVKSRTTWANLKKRAEQEDAQKAAERDALIDLIADLDVNTSTGEIVDDDDDWDSLIRS